MCGDNRRCTQVAFADKSLELYRADFGAILLPLATALGLLIVIERTLDSSGGAVEEIDRRPEQVLEVRFKTCVGQRCDEGIEDVGDRAANKASFGERPRIRFRLVGAVAMELELGEPAALQGKLYGRDQLARKERAGLRYWVAL